MNIKQATQQVADSVAILNVLKNFSQQEFIESKVLRQQIKEALQSLTQAMEILMSHPSTTEKQINNLLEVWKYIIVMLKAFEVYDSE